MIVWFTVIDSLGQLLSTFYASSVPKYQEIRVCFWINYLSWWFQKSTSSLFYIYLYLILAAETCITPPSALPWWQHLWHSTPRVIWQIIILFKKTCFPTTVSPSFPYPALFLFVHQLSYKRWCATLCSQGNLWFTPKGFLYQGFQQNVWMNMIVIARKGLSCFFPSVAASELFSRFQKEKGILSSVSGSISVFEMDPVSTML